MSSTPTKTVSKVSLILEIIQLALTGLSVVPQTAEYAAIAQTFLGIFQNATAAYQAEVGQPFDVTKIPLEAPVA